METFGSVISDLLDYVNRPASELRPAAARAINNTIQQVQRRHAFKMSEKLISVTYPANSLSIDLVEANQGSPRDLMSVQLAGDSNTAVGTPFAITTYRELVSQTDKYNRTARADEFKEEAFNEPYQYGNHISRNRAYQAFLVGKQLGLYPTPTVDVNLIVNFNLWLPKMNQDTETNFLLEFCTDYIFTRALQTLQLHLKIDKRYPITKAELDDLWESVSQWDSQIRNYPGVTI